MCQKVTATLLGVSIDTLVDWELGKRQPKSRNIPKIIKFLGYDPALPHQNVASLIARERKRRGLSIVQMAAEIGVCDDTLRNWEAGRYLPMKSGFEKLMAFINPHATLPPS